MSKTKTNSEDKIQLSDNIDFVALALSNKLETSEDILPICFYCKKCEKMVTDVEKKKNKLVFTCKECKSNDIAIGTQTTLENFYHVN